VGTYYNTFYFLIILINRTPKRAFVPRTPIDLLPFITKTNELWTSDMETPDSKFNEKYKSCNKSENSIDIVSFEINKNNIVIY
jgi:hypothetical protein